MSRGKKERFAYSFTVVHFRKSVICQKVGSPQNDHQVIPLHFYNLTYNCRLLKLYHEKDE
ncbi:hypothetical protein DMZ73_24660 [Salmonella enterica subsp. enterica serovar Inganda]|nr:hypothetical protein [Salmonella enterica subsp. enterica serovar Inganda]ECH8970990.1 hypothetical protein [Salmonella enterica subsp. enterica]